MVTTSKVYLQKQAWQSQRTCAIWQQHHLENNTSRVQVASGGPGAQGRVVQLGGGQNGACSINLGCSPSSQDCNKTMSNDGHNAKTRFAEAGSAIMTYLCHLAAPPSGKNIEPCSGCRWRSRCPGKGCTTRRRPVQLLPQFGLLPQQPRLHRGKYQCRKPTSLNV